MKTLNLMEDSCSQPGLGGTEFYLLNYRKFAAGLYWYVLAAQEMAQAGLFR